MSTQMVHLRIMKTLCVSYCTFFIKLLRLPTNTLHTCAHKDVRSEPWILLLAATWVVTLIPLVFVCIKIHTFSFHMVRQLRRKIPHMCSVCVPCVCFWLDHNLPWLLLYSPCKPKGNVTTCASNVGRLWNYTLILTNDSSYHRLPADFSTEKHHQCILCHYMT